MCVCVCVCVCLVWKGREREKEDVVIGESVCVRGEERELSVCVGLV